MNRTKEMIQNPRAITPQDCRALYGLNPGTLANLRLRKVGPQYYKLGRKVLYKPQDIEEWLDSNKILTADSIQRG
jgi:hypothetical protein